MRLCERLCELAPEGLERVFLADSGSVSVEVAIKLCLQFQRAQGRPARTRLLTVRGGYHGDTAGAMALCDPVGGMHSLFTGLLARHVFAERPPDGFDAGLDEAWAAGVRELVERHSDELAGIVVEPVVQGAGGMRFHSPACVTHLRELCDEHGLLLVLDEIATGFGRTGTLFASEHARVSPDVMCLGKALTGGYMTMAATLCTAAVAEAVSGGEGGGLMHGPTFMANPLACAVSLASLGLLADGSWQGRVAGHRAGSAQRPGAGAGARVGQRREGPGGDRGDRARPRGGRRRRHRGRARAGSVGAAVPEPGLRDAAVRDRRGRARRRSRPRCWRPPAPADAASRGRRPAARRLTTATPATAAACRRRRAGRGPVPAAAGGSRPRPRPARRSSRGWSARAPRAPAASR